jgi:lambda family phage portal protein
MKERKPVKRPALRLPKPNKMERELAATAPEFAAEIYKARCAVALAQGYTGASRSRRSMAEWQLSAGDADTDILPDLDTLRVRSRDLERNNALAGAVIATKTTSVVGTGLKLQARPNRELLGLDDEQADAWENLVEAEWAMFAAGCDYERLQSLAGLQDLAFRSTLCSGDVLVNTPYRLDPGQVYGTKIQLIEADRIVNDNSGPDTLTLSGGVERQNGFPWRYHVMTTHPGSTVNPTREWLKLDAYAASGRRRAWLLLFRRRIGQWRGVPDLAPIIEDLKQIGRYKEAELMAAVVASMLTVFVKSNSPGGLNMQNIATETGQKSSDKDFKLGSGLILDLAPDEDVSVVNPGRPNPAFEGFVNAITAEIGARLEIPMEVLTKRFQSSYSAARGAFLMAWQYFRTMRTWLAEQFLAPLYELFLTEAVLLGRVPAAGFLTGDPLIRAAWLGCEWIGDAPGHLDEGKAVAAARDRIDAGLSNEAVETVALTGMDRDVVYRGRKKEITQRRADDMMLGVIAADAQAAVPVAPPADTGDQSQPE